ncbi:MAG: hypothetical protein SGI77_00235 [Pirellulaceae bacterium]|nr:hypothetical protein [Pirellulaceae bacterium]
MSRRRSANTGPGSLDLFLDTICNTFGGIIFMAILLSILVQLRSETDDASLITDKKISKAEAAQYSAELERLDSNRRQLEMAVQLLEQKIPTDEQSGSQSLLQKLNETRRRLTKAIDQQKSLSERLSDIRSDNQRLDLETHELNEQLEKATAALEAKTQALDEELDARKQKIQLPRVRDTFKRNLIILMRYGKLYTVYASNGAGFNKTHVAASNQGKKVNPIRSAGWEIQSKADRLEVEQLLQGHQPTNEFISLAVWQDSFEAFAEVKKLFIEHGFEYQLIPVDFPDGITLGNSNTVPQVQ